jgi:hypothetical protein
MLPEPRWPVSCPLNSPIVDYNLAKGVAPVDGIVQELAQTAEEALLGGSICL